MRRTNGNPPRPLPLHSEVGNHDVGMVAPVKSIAGRNVPCLKDHLDPGILQHSPAALQHDRMVIDDQNAGHDCALMVPFASAGALRASTTGMLT